MSSERLASLLTAVANFLNQSLRPALGYSFGAATIYLTLTGYLSAEAFLGMAGLILGFFFRARDEAKDQERIAQKDAELERKADALVELAKAVPPPPSPDPSSR